MPTENHNTIIFYFNSLKLQAPRTLRFKHRKHLTSSNMRVKIFG